MPAMTDRELRVHCADLVASIFQGKGEHATAYAAVELARDLYEFITAEPKGEGLGAIISTADGATWRWSRDDLQWQRHEPAKQDEPA